MRVRRLGEVVESWGLLRTSHQWDTRDACSGYHRTGDGGGRAPVRRTSKTFKTARGLGFVAFLTFDYYDHKSYR